jgi:hypothetical protein
MEHSLITAEDANHFKFTAENYKDAVMQISRLLHDFIRLHIQLLAKRDEPRNLPVI